MRKTLTFIHRVALTLGVLVALTPCGVCHKAGVTSTAMAHCTMDHKAGHDCCHAKKASPLCQVMDQSSVSVTPVHLDNAVVQVVSVEFPALKVPQAVVVPSLVLSSSPPLRGPLALRI